MTKTPYIHPSDLNGFSRLVVEATLRLTDLVEAMHRNIASIPGTFGVPVNGPAWAITELVYGSVRGVTQMVGGGMDAILAQLTPWLGERPSSPEREAVLAALNGVMGDYLAASDNPLAISMELRQNGQALTLERQALQAAIPQPSGKLLVLAHGLCMNDLQWTRQGHDHGVALARDLGYTPVYLHYNTGLHVSTNGRPFADLLETLLAAWPVAMEELVILAHSMGGLVTRSACHYGAQAGHTWLRYLRKIAFIGTPHQGSALERAGSWLHLLLGISPYSAPLARLGKIRSAGITDLRYGTVLEEDWQDRDRFAHTKDQRHPLPLPEGVPCYAIAGTAGKAARGPRAQWLGDGLVPLHSALGQHLDPTRQQLSLAIPETRQWVCYDTHHFELLSSPEAYEHLREWLV
jgi:hypothetical protein